MARRGAADGHTRGETLAPRRLGRPHAPRTMAHKRPNPHGVAALYSGPISSEQSPMKDSLALKALDSLRRLFEAESALGRPPVQHVLVVYPEYHFAQDMQSRGVEGGGGGGGGANAPLSRLFCSATHAPWPPGHAIRLPPEPLHEASGLVRFERGAWRSGFYGDAGACARFRGLASDAVRALSVLIATSTASTAGASRAAAPTRVDAPPSSTGRRARSGRTLGTG
jgi:hypothetical protein